MVLRDYQQDAVQAVFDGWAAGIPGNYVICLPTGSGKSLVIAALVERLHSQWGARILMLVHSRELIAQNAEKLLHLWPSAPVGIYSAGLGKRELHEPIVFAGIQSIAKHIHKRDAFDIVIVDEVHSVSTEEGTLYKKTLNMLLTMNPNMRVIGLSATPFRLTTGWIHKGDDRIFHHMAYNADILRLIADGWLSNLTTKAGKVTIDTSKVAHRGAEFVTGELEKAAMAGDITEIAVSDMIARASDRRCWIVFAIGVDHAKQITDCLMVHGVSAEMVTGDTPKEERDEIIRRHKSGETRCVVNVAVLTTGYDNPRIDMIGILRPTESAGLHIQILGRGMRRAEGKRDCIAEDQMVLTDYGLVKIQNVKKYMKVWDGLTYVSHDGIVLRGEREVITYAGLTATPDHKVYTKEGWRTFGECSQKQIPIRVTGNGRDGIQLSEGYIRDGFSERKEESLDVGKVHEMRRRKIGIDVQFEKKYSWVQEMREPKKCSKMALQQMFISKRKMHKSKNQRIQKLRRERDTFQILYSIGDGYIYPRKHRYSSGYGNRQDRQFKRLRNREHQIFEKKIKYEQHKKKTEYSNDAQIQNGTPRDTVCRLNLGCNVFKRDVFPGYHRKIQQEIVQTKRRVWDILNSGPRNCFTVEGLLVHNCVVLDYAGNCMRFGPIDKIDPDRKPGKGDGIPPSKCCPVCDYILPAATMQCPACGYEFPVPEKNIEHVASDAPVLSTDIVPVERKVNKTWFSVHSKPGKDACVKIEYECGLGEYYYDWVFPKSKFRSGYLKECKAFGVLACEDAHAWVSIANGRKIEGPHTIWTIPDGKYTKVVRKEFYKDTLPDFMHWRPDDEARGSEATDRAM